MIMRLIVSQGVQMILYHLFGGQNIFGSVDYLGRMEFGGGGEIRTLGGLSPSLVFKTSALNRSATPP